MILKSQIMAAVTLIVFWSSYCQANPCSKVESTVLEMAGKNIAKNSQDVRDEYIVTASNSYLKGFNTNVFHEWTRGSEYLTNVMHFFFQYHLNAGLNKTGIAEVARKKSPWVKNLEINLFSENLPRETLKQVLNEARHKAVNSLSDYIWNESSGAKDLIAEISDVNSPTSFSKKYVFSENKNFLTKLTTSQRQRMVEAVTRHYGDQVKFKDFMKKAYSLGVGKTLYDSHFAAKVAAATSTSRVVSFEQSTLKKILIGAKNQRKALDHVFANKTDQQIIDIFSMVRKYIDLPPSQWPQQMIQVASTQRRGRNYSQEYLVQDFSKRMKTFQKTLNFLDYLPVEYTKVDAFASNRIASLQSPEMVMFVDVKGLGARNYLTFMKSIEPLLKDVATLERLVKKTETLESALENEAVREVYDRLAQQRQFILAESNVYLNSVKLELIAAAKKAGLKEGDFEYWASGDDIYLVTRKKDSGPTYERLISEFNRSQTLSKGTRLAYWLPSRSNVTLDQARVNLGSLVHFQKAVEGMFFDYSTTTFMTDAMLQQRRIGVWKYSPEAGRQRIEVEHRDAMRLMASGWELHF